MLREPGRWTSLARAALVFAFWTAAGGAHAASPPASAPVEPCDGVVTGELVRVHLPRRAFLLKVGRPARELEVKVDDSSAVLSSGQRTALRDLRPGDRATVVCSVRSGVRYVRIARFIAPRR